MTGSELLKQAEKYLGDKGNTFWKAYGYDHAVAWCCIWVWYVFKKAKCCELFYDCGKVQNVANADAWLRRNAEWVKIKDAQPGDIVIFTWDAKGGNNTRVGHRDHIGIVVKAENSTTLKTIEGNVGSNNSAKSKVDYRTRKAKLFCCNPCHIITGADSIHLSPRVQTRKIPGNIHTTANLAGFASGYSIIRNKRLQQQYGLTTFLLLHQATSLLQFIRTPRPERKIISRADLPEQTTEGHDAENRKY